MKSYAAPAAVRWLLLLGVLSPSASACGMGRMGEALVGIALPEAAAPIALSVVAGLLACRPLTAGAGVGLGVALVLAATGGLSGWMLSLMVSPAVGAWIGRKLELGLAEGGPGLTTAG